MTRRTAVARFAIIVCAVLFTLVVYAQQITLKPGAIRDKEIHRNDARDFAYCEITPVFGKPPNAMAQANKRSLDHPIGPFAHSQFTNVLKEAMSLPGTRR
jgi:hypothetical protein